MNVGIIGAGPFGLALAARSARHGIKVRATTRDLEGAAARAHVHPELAGCSSFLTSMAELLATSDLLVLAVPHPVAVRLSRRFPAFAAGRTIVDATNPWSPAPSAPFTAGAGCLDIARALPYARVVKAFNTVSVASLRSDTVSTVPYATDEASAARAVEDLARRLALRPVPVGPLVHATHLESSAFIRHLISQESPS
ncbi:MULTISPECIES: NADPH-dependent F420 reductase [unclassified Streptomyces]|uniref:NADPH-dependent F420 reductase n=1 Tax=unclassified Streptomyces TaxID=2593676 RepID=UPI002E2AEA37|nr:NAD(P)-binding domain-containing protein [Streptomyces sp. NBC_00273]